MVNWTDPVYLNYNQGDGDHLYTNAVLPYFRAPHILLGFPTRFLSAKEQTEPTFMASRDGTTFHRWPEAIIPTTAPEERDGNRSNYMAWGLVQLPGEDKELSVYATERYYAGPGGRLRRFTYRVDGFASVSAGPEGGFLTTKLVRTDGAQLVVNFQTRGRGSLRVGVLDQAGKFLPGHGLDDCRELRGNAVGRRVSWKNDDSRGLAKGPIRLLFDLTDAELYSFRFQ
jgi:hypothetical protein